MKRLCIALAFILILIPLLSVPVYASAGDDSGGILSSIGTFFKWLGDLIKDWLIKAMNFLLKGLKTLFIPSDGFFSKLSDRLYNAFQQKFGGMLSLLQYLKERFANLKAYRGDLLVLKFPKEHLFGGKQVDIMQGAEGISDLIRAALSGFVVICTAIFGYRKVLAMTNA